MRNSSLSHEHQKFSIVGLQYTPDDYMTEDGMKRMLDMLPDDDNGKHFEILHVEGNNSIAMFLITGEVYDLLPVEDFSKTVTDILDDVEKENESGVYIFKDHSNNLREIIYYLQYL